MIKKMMLLGLLMGVFILPTHADEQMAHEHVQEAVVENQIPIKVGNKICPVSGDPIDSMDGFEIEYDGKVYNLCCKMCVKDFNADPEKYIAIVEAEVSEAGMDESVSEDEMSEGDMDDALVDDESDDEMMMKEQEYHDHAH